MDIIVSTRRRFLYFVALLAFSTTHGFALEELMPLVPAGGYSMPDNAEFAARQIDGLGMAIDKPRPAILHKNVIKLKIPSPDSTSERKLSPSFAAEAMGAYDEFDSFDSYETRAGFDDDIPMPPANFIPPPPRSVALAKTEDPPIPIITPASRQMNLRPPGSDSGRVAALEPLAPVRMASSPQYSPPPLPEIEPYQYDIMTMAPAKPVARPSTPYGPSGPPGEIPGLVTPELLAIGNDVLSSFNARSPVGGRDDFQDLIGFQQPTVEYRTVSSVPLYDAQQASDIFTTEPAKQYVMVSKPVVNQTLTTYAPPLQEFPIIGDPYVSTLEPFTPQPESFLPQPSPISLPRPVVKNAATFHSRAVGPVYTDTTPLPVVSAVKTIPMTHYQQPQNHYVVSQAEPMPSITMTPTQALSTMAAPTPVIPNPPSVSTDYYSPQPQPQPQSGDNSSRQSSGPLLLPIPPTAMQQQSAPPITTSVVNKPSQAAPAPQRQMQSAPRNNSAPAGSQSGQYAGFMPDGNLPSALTPDEFAVLETQGYPEPARPSGRRRPPAEVYAQQQAAKMQARAPEPVPEEQEVEQEEYAEPQPAPRNRKKVDGFTDMKGNRTAIGPPSPKAFSTKNRW